MNPLIILINYKSIISHTLSMVKINNNNHPMRRASLSSQCINSKSHPQITSKLCVPQRIEIVSSKSLTREFANSISKL